MTLAGSGCDLEPIGTSLAVVRRQAAGVADFVYDDFKYGVHKERRADAKVDRLGQEYHLPIQKFTEQYQDTVNELVTKMARQKILASLLARTKLYWLFYGRNCKK